MKRRSFYRSSPPPPLAVGDRVQIVSSGLFATVLSLDGLEACVRDERGQTGWLSTRSIFAAPDESGIAKAKAELKRRHLAARRAERE